MHVTLSVHCYGTRSINVPLPVNFESCDGKLHCYDMNVLQGII